MLIVTRAGREVLAALGPDGEFTRCLHSKADLDINKRLILHFPEDNTIWSVGSGYGGNVLLGKKCLSLRIASYLGRLHDLDCRRRHRLEQVGGRRPPLGR